VLVSMSGDALTEGLWGNDVGSGEHLSSRDGSRLQLHAY